MGSYYEEIRKLKLISECYVKPTNAIPKNPIYLGVTDLFETILGKYEWTVCIAVIWSWNFWFHGGN